jgi:hypothetical protein
MRTTVDYYQNTISCTTPTGMNASSYTLKYELQDTASLLWYCELQEYWIGRDLHV